MARPRLDSSPYRLPTYSASDNRWRLRIEHGHGCKEFRWPAGESKTECPPQIIAAAVAAQDQFRQIKKDWQQISFAMSCIEPTKDWTKPVWISPDQIIAAENFVEATRNKNRQIHQVQTAYSAAAIGLDSLANTLATLTPGAPHNPGGLWEADRIALLAQLRPIVARTEAKSIRAAMTAYLSYHEGRTKLVVGDYISPATFKAMRKTLLAAFGLSSSKEMPVIRKIKLTQTVDLDLDRPLQLLDRDVLDQFARFWHSMPTGKSSRTIRNRLKETRAFFAWCAAKQWMHFPDDIAKLYTAEDVKTPAVSFDANRIKKILSKANSRGGNRLKLYTLLGLLCGYTQADVCRIANREYFEDSGDCYIKRIRTKERRSKRGSRPLAIKHWIAPELAKLIDAERKQNPQGFLFNSESGRVLNVKSVTNIWDDARKAADDKLPYKQLRKMGYNRIKHHADSLEVAEIWDGHSGGISDHYDDHIFIPVQDAQRKFAEELRDCGIL